MASVAGASPLRLGGGTLGLSGLALSLLLLVQLSAAKVSPGASAAPCRALPAPLGLPSS